MDERLHESLSPQQRECLRMVWQQHSSKEIALQLGISKNTVDGYIAEAVNRLGARDRRHAARLCFGVRPPDLMGGDPPRVDQATISDAGLVGGTSNPSEPWRRWLPFRTGAHNDLHPLARLLWIFVIAALGAIGFGALASGVHLINELVR